MRSIAWVTIAGLTLLAACSDDPCSSGLCNLDAGNGGGGGGGVMDAGPMDSGVDAGDGYDAGVYDGGGPMGVSDAGATIISGPLAFTPATTFAARFYHGDQGEELDVTATNEAVACFLHPDAGVLDAFDVLSLNLFDAQQLVIGMYTVGVDAGPIAYATFAHGQHGGVPLSDGGFSQATYDFELAVSGTATLDFIDRRDGVTQDVHASGTFDLVMSDLDGGSTPLSGSFNIDCAN